MPPLETAVGIDRANDRRNDADPLFGQGDAYVIGAPILTLTGSPNEQSGFFVPQIRSTIEFNQLANEQRLRFIQECQGALRFVEAQLTDDADNAGDRQECLDRLLEGDAFQSRDARDRLIDLFSLPSFRTYWEAFVAANLFREDLEAKLPEDEDLDISEYSGFEIMESVMIFLLGLARAEAQAIGADLDVLMRGTLTGRPVPTGSPTAGIR